MITGIANCFFTRFGDNVSGLRIMPALYESRRRFLRSVAAFAYLAVFQLDILLYTIDARSDSVHCSIDRDRHCHLVCRGQSAATLRVLIFRQPLITLIEPALAGGPGQ
jgi:hypothetical protein